MKEGKILTRKAVEIINKKLKNKRLTQQDSNYLSRFVRPKLREIITIDAKSLLRKLEYSPKAKPIEGRIKEAILKNLSDVDSIIICGSAIQYNYNKYEDLDVIIAAKKVINSKQKEKIILKIKKSAEDLPMDIQIYSKKSILAQYSHNPSLIYQLKDSKIIYGDI